MADSSVLYATIMAKQLHTRIKKQNKMNYWNPYGKKQV